MLSATGTTSRAKLGRSLIWSCNYLTLSTVLTACLRGAAPARRQRGSGTFTRLAGVCYTAKAMDILAAHAARHPERPAVLEGDRTLTWGEYVALRNRLAHALVTRCLGSGAHVTIYAQN